MPNSLCHFILFLSRLCLLWTLTSAPNSLAHIWYGGNLMSDSLVNHEPWKKTCTTYTHKFIHDYDLIMTCHIASHVGYMTNLITMWIDLKGLNCIDQMDMTCFWHGTCQNKITMWGGLWCFLVIRDNVHAKETFAARKSALRKEVGLSVTFDVACLVKF